MGRRRVVSPVPVKSPRDNLRDEKKQRERAQERAQALHEQGMPFQMALAVAHGRLDLNEALERMARNDRILRLMKKHDLSRALATQVALGQADLDRVLYTRRFDDHRKGNRARSVLDEVKESGAPIVLGLHGGGEIEAKVTGGDTYSIVAEPPGSEPRDVHKLQVKYAYRPGDARKVSKARLPKPATGFEPRGPIERPQDRYACSDKRLFRYLDRKIPVVVTLLEGERFAGRVEWFSRFEIQLAAGDEPVVTVFRHALADLAELGAS
jgi:sRNA-binding regulator protein Hfq